MSKNEAAENEPTPDDQATATTDEAEAVIGSQAEAPALELVKKADPVTMHRMALDVEVNTHFRITVKQNVTPEQCMDEAFWCHLTNRLTPGDTLIVRPDDSSWELILNVVDNGPNFAHVHKKSFCELIPAVPREKLPSIYTIDHAGPIHKWRFLREGKMMRDGFATRELAIRAAAQHEMAVNRSVPK